MGTVISQTAAGSDAGARLLDALILTGPASRPALPLSAAIPVLTATLAAAVGSSGFVSLIDAMTFGAFNKAVETRPGVFGDTRTDFDWLSRDGAEVDK